MEKDFDKWNEQKKYHNERRGLLTVHKREVWWGAVGLNIGSEQDGKGKGYERPILVLATLSKSTFIGVPLSTKEKKHSMHFLIVFKETNNYALIDQIKVFDVRRLNRKIGVISQNEFNDVCKIIQKIFFVDENPR